MTLLVSLFILGLVLTAPVFCVIGISEGGQGHFQECSSAVGLPERIAVPLFVVVLVTSFGAMVYVDRHE